jgi:hypothetical protein
MVMEMCAVGGLRPTEYARPPFWEDMRVATLPGDPSWLDSIHGKAVKFLNPTIQTPAPGLGYKWIWLERDEEQQVKSQHKTSAWFARRQGKNLKRRPIDIPETTIECLALIESLGGPVLRMRYEDILDDPVQASCDIAAHFACGLDPFAMARVVKKRSPECLDHMAEDERIPKEDGAPIVIPARVIPAQLTGRVKQ